MIVQSQRLQSQRPTWRSRGSAAMFGTLLLCVAARGAEPAPADTPLLQWRNGDGLPGRVRSLGPTEVEWETPIFAEPVRVALDALAQIKFPAREIQPEKPSLKLQALETMAGNRLLGSVTSITDDFITIQSQKYGRLQLARAAVWAISNPFKKSHLVAGLSGLEGWTTRTYGRKLSEWDELPGGRLTTRLVAAELYRPLEFVGRIDIDIELQWTRNPSFQLRFLTPFAKTTREALKVETRSESIVVQSLSSSGRFQPLGELPRNADRCRFTLRWDNLDNQLSIYLGDDYLGKIQVENDSAPSSAGLYIKNTGPSLTINRLEITGGRRLRQGLSDPNLDSVVAEDQSLSGMVSQAPGSANIAVKQPNGEAVEIAWDSIAAIRFRGEPGGDTDDDDLKSCVLFSGEILRGQLIRADEQTVWLRLPSMREPIRCQWDEIERHILNEPSDPPTIKAARLVIGNTMLHGSFERGADGGLAWLPMGGKQPGRLTNSLPARLFLQPLKASGLTAIQSDTVYLLNGDMFPCHIESIRERRTSLVTAFAGSIQVDTTRLRALQFVAGEMQPTVGFGDGWTSRGNVTLDDSRSKVIFGEQGGTWSHASVLRGNTVEFELSTDLRFTALELRLLGRPGINSETIQIALLGDRLFVMTDRNRAAQSTIGVGSPARIRLRAEANLQLELNDQLVFSQASSGGPWSGISIKVTPMPERGRLAERKLSEGAATIEAFRIVGRQRLALGIALPYLDDALLTLPRQRPDPPQQLLLGSNGDVVRGSLTALDGEAVTFRSRSREFQLPRSAVTGVVWFDPPPADPRQLTRLVMTDHSVVTLLDPRLDSNRVRGRHPDLGDAQLLLEDVSEILLGGAESSELNDFVPRLLAKPAIEPQFEDIEPGREFRVDSPLVGQQLQDIEFPLLNDQVRRLFEYQGKVLILEFWATWCAPCVKHMPGLIEMVGQLPRASVALLAVDYQEEKLLVEQMRDARGWDLEVALDPTGILARNFLVEGLPHTVIIDQQGKVVAVFVGAGSGLHAEIRAVVEQLITE